MSLQELPERLLGCILASSGPIDTVISFQGSQHNSLLPGRIKERTLQLIPFWREFNKYNIGLLDLRDVEIEAGLLADILSNVPTLHTLDLTNTQLSLGQVWSILNYKISERENLQGVEMGLRVLKATNNRSVNLSIDTLTKIYPMLSHLHFGNTEFTAGDVLHVLRTLRNLELLDITYSMIDWTRIEAEEVGLLINDSPIHTFIVHELPPSLENVFLGLQVTVIKDTIPQALLDCTTEEEVERIERLITMGADPNVTCSKTHPAFNDIGSYAAIKALHRITEESQGLMMFQVLCRGSLDLSYHQQEEPFTLLQGCIERAYVSLASLLLRCGADIIPSLSSSFNELPAVCKAAVQGEDGIIQAFIDLNLHNHPIPKNFCDLICSAIQSRKESVLELVLEHGAKMRRCKNHPNFLLKNPETLDIILKSEYREVINISPDMIYEALQYHSFLGAELIVKSMIESTLELIDLCGNEEMILAERHPSTSRAVVGSSNFHKPILIIAIVTPTQERKCFDLVRFLLDTGFDVNASDGFGWTALISASSCGYLECIGYLCSKGAMINKRDNVGRTALHQAAQNGHVSVVTELLKYGATANPLCNMDQSPLYLATLNRHKDVIALLKPQANPVTKRRACQIF